MPAASVSIRFGYNQPCHCARVLREKGQIGLRRAGGQVQLFQVWQPSSATPAPAHIVTAQIQHTACFKIELK